MLVSTKPEADFSRGCAGRRIGHLVFETHPHPAIRDLTQGDTPSEPIRSGLCRIAVTDFRGRTFHAVWCISFQSMRLTPPSGIMRGVDPLENDARWQGGELPCR
jgi:hypothetical protein